MPASKFIIPAPMKGFVEAAAFASQPPLTSPSMLNVMLLDQQFGRYRPAQRPGTGKYDLFDFFNGHTVNAGTLTIPINGGDTNYINITNRGCYTLSSTSSGVDVVIVGVDGNSACGPHTVKGNGGGSSGPGTTTITTIGGTPPSGGGTIQGGGICVTDCSNDDNAERPYLRLRVCSTGETTNQWIYQSVLSIYGALPALFDNNFTSSTAGMCLYVTAQRASLANIGLLTDWIRDQTDFTPFPTCGACDAPATQGYWKYTRVFNCDTGEWSGEAPPIKRCILASAAGDALNQWGFDGSKADATRTFDFYLASDTDCTTTDDFADLPTQQILDDAELDQKTTTLIATPPTGDASCGDTYTVKLYRASTDALLHTYASLTSTPPSVTSFFGTSDGGLNGVPQCNLYRSSPICGDSPGSWQFEDLGRTGGGIAYFHHAGDGSTTVPLGRYDQCTGFQNSDMYIIVSSP